MEELIKKLEDADSVVEVMQILHEIPTDKRCAEIIEKLEADTP